MDGIALRDWFAGQAMIGMIIANGKRMIDDAAETEYNGLRYPDDGCITGQAQGVAEDAYAIADAMLGVRLTCDGRYPDEALHGETYAKAMLNKVREDHLPEGWEEILHEESMNAPHGGEVGE